MERMTTDKDAKEMAEEWAHRNVFNRCPAYSDRKHAFEKGVIAGFQKCDLTVAQPLREENERLKRDVVGLDNQLSILKSCPEFLHDPDHAQIRALTAEVEKLKEYKWKYEELCK